MAKVTISKDIMMMSIKNLKPYEKNSKKHPKEQIDKLTKHIEHVGWDQPIVVDEDNVIIKGHGRLEVAKKLKLKEVPVIVKDDLSEIQKKACRIADNKLAESEWDFDLLKEDLTDLAVDMDLTDLGFDTDLLNEMSGGSGESYDEDKDTVPDIDETKEPIAKLGDIYELGKHRIMCGDSTSDEDVSKLMNGQTVDMILTDPPYGVSYSDKNKTLNKYIKGERCQTPILNDSIENYQAFFKSFLEIIPMSDYNTAYIYMSGQELHSLRLAFEEAGFKWSDYLIWVKNNHVLGRKDYNSKHEFCMYGWKNHHKFYGQTNSVTTLEFDKPLKNDLHPTMKPIKLLKKNLEDGSKKHNVIYDAFLGSGSTLIACETTNRTCYGMELDPYYIDVIIERWEKYTGKKAVKVEG